MTGAIKFAGVTTGVVDLIDGEMAAKNVKRGVSRKLLITTA
jgi:hypothetical protein